MKKITIIYLHFVNIPDFIHTMARDGAFKKSVFLDAGNLLLRTNLISETVHEIWTDFVEKVGKKAQEDEEAEKELGDIPDEFLGKFPGIL